MRGLVRVGAAVPSSYLQIGVTISTAYRRLAVRSPRD